MGCASSTPADLHANGVQAAKYVAPSAAASALPSMNGVSSAAATQGSPSVAAPLTSPSPIPAKSPSFDVRSSLAPPPVDSRISQETKRSSSQLANGPQTPGSSESSSAVNPSLKSLTVQEVHTVQSTLMKVSVLIQKFAEGKNDRTTPIQALRRAMDLVIADAHANYASVQVVHETLDSALLVALVGAPDQFLEHNRLQRLGQSGTAAEIMIGSKTDCLTWNPSAGAQLPTDWHQLVTGAAMRHLSAVPIRVAERIIGILTLGFTEDGETHADHALWSTYLQLVAASLSSVVKDSAIPKYLTLVKEVYLASEIDGLIHMMVTHMRSVLGHSNNHHNWYRFALTGSSNMAATIFDDLTQVPVTLMQRGLSSHAGSSSNRLLKEVQASGGVMRTVVAMKSTVMKISVHNRQQVMIPDVQKLINQSGNVSVDIFNTRLIKPPTSVLVFPLKVKHHIFGVVFCMSSVATDFADVSPRLRELCEVVSPHILTMLNTTLALEYSVVQNALPSNPEGGSMSGIMISQSSRNASFSGRSIGGNNDAAASFASNDSFVFTQSRSSTGALVTGLTEKLNQKRIKSSMDFAGTHALGDLQVQALLGEGGFAKVFRGLWRGLVVGIKVVCDDGKNEKMVMKNAHEIAILGALSHPNIVQAYTCLTDVAVHDLLTSSFRTAPLGVLHSPAYKYLAGMEDRPCHIEVIEYCDLGNLSTALKYAVFQVPHPEKVLAAAVALGNKEGPGGSDANGGEVNASNQLLAEVRGQAGRVQMRTLLLTLIEIASAMAYLHRMGVVHCDIKPANVLLRSSSTDTRGFTAKVSDFGLSRVEDDEMHASFPFNSCGTAAYVAPEALICNKKVNSSVDVYAFGILMWEMYTCARPYGNMKQQALVEEVVMRGLRPRFPSHTPPPYILLAQACWSGSAQSRPLFDEALTTLNNMLSALDDREIGSTASASFASNTDVVEYMAANSPGGGGPAMNGTQQAPGLGAGPMQGGGFAEGPKSPTGGVVDRIVAGRSSNGAAALRGVMVGDNSPARSAAGTGSGGPSGTMPSVYAALNSGGASSYGGGSGNVNGPGGRRTVSRNTSMTGDGGKHGSFPAQPSGLSAMTSPYISPAKDTLVPAVTASVQ